MCVAPDEKYCNGILSEIVGRESGSSGDGTVARHVDGVCQDVNTGVRPNRSMHIVCAGWAEPPGGIRRG